jgi:hypothetical protein
MFHKANHDQKTGKGIVTICYIVARLMQKLVKMIMQKKRMDPENIYHLAPFLRFVLLATARRLSFRLRPPLLIGFLWSHSLLSPTASPSFALAAFRCERAAICAGLP